MIRRERSNSDATFDSILEDEEYNPDRYYGISRSALKKKKVLQENLVYLVGLPEELADPKVFSFINL